MKGFQSFRVIFLVIEEIIEKFTRQKNALKSTKFFVENAEFRLLEKMDSSDTAEMLTKIVSLSAKDSAKKYETIE